MDEKITKIEIVTRPDKFQELKEAFNKIGITGMTVTNVLGCGAQKGYKEFYRGLEVEINLLRKIKVEVVVSEVPVDLVIDTAIKVLRTGKIGDGKIFIYDISKIVRIRTGEEGWDALQDHK